MKRLFRWLLGLLSFVTGDKRPAPKTIVPLLIFPTMTDDIQLDKITELGSDKYYTSSPWKLSPSMVNKAIKAGEDWLTEALGTRFKWDRVRTVDSQRSIAEWRSSNIYLIKDEVDHLGLPWTDDYIYLAFVRGMGGYTGGIGYENGIAGYAMVGDICLEAICGYPAPTAGSALLGADGWPSNSYSLTGQTGAFIHKALHGLGLPHPDGWLERNRPHEDATLMGNWWNMPDFKDTKGLTQMEIEKVLQWTVS